MTKKAINVIIGIVLAFIVVFFAGSFAYEQYVIQKSDSDYENSLDKDLDETQKENGSGDTNQDLTN